MSTMKMYRYSEAFKQQVVKEIEEGTLRIAEAARMYDISVAGIYNWLHNLGKDHLIGKVVYVKKRNELDKIKKLELEKKQLEAALAKSHLSVFCLESMIEAAEKTYGIDIKKNSGMRVSKKAGSE